jgi:adhesin/invasin
MVRKRQISRVAPGLSLALTALLLSCESGTESPDPVLSIEKTASASGDNQSWGTGHNMPFPLRVIVTTQGGTPVEGVEVTWAVEPGNGFIAALIPVTGADGISTARWGMGTVVGTVHATASAEGINGSPVTFTATAIPNLPQDVSIASGDGQAEAVNTQLSDPFVVFVEDQFGNPFPGQGIEWVITSGSGTLSTTLSVSNEFGNASTFLTLSSTPGVVTVLARFPAAQSGPRVTFTATAIP